MWKESFFYYQILPTFGYPYWKVFAWRNTQSGSPKSNLFLLFLSNTFLQQKAKTIIYFFFSCESIQKLLCKPCGQPSDAHSHCYKYQCMKLTIEVKRLHIEKHLAGENEGRLWMWSCCGKCKPLKFTKRVVLSTAACRLSFGKFLELGFSNQTSSDMTSSCGHLFHRDYLHFFGYAYSHLYQFVCMIVLMSTCNLLWFAD